jgi:hypothetical protein
MTSIHKPKTLETFVADWNAVGSPEYIDYGRFTEAGHDIHCSNTYRVSREGVNPKILGLHSPNRSLTVSPTWHKEGVGLTLGYPGVHGLGQAIYPIAELRADGSIVELHGWGQQPVPEVAAGERAFGSAMAPTAVTPDNAQVEGSPFSGPRATGSWRRFVPAQRLSTDLPTNRPRSASTAGPAQINAP